MGIRLNKVLTELNIGLQTAVDFLKNKKSVGEIRDDVTTNTKITDEQYEALVHEFSSDKAVKTQADKLFPKKKEKKPEQPVKTKTEEEILQRQQFKPLGKIDLDSLNKPKSAQSSGSPATKPEPKAAAVSPAQKPAESPAKAAPQPSTPVVEPAKPKEAPKEEPAVAPVEAAKPAAPVVEEKKVEQPVEQSAEQPAVEPAPAAQPAASAPQPEIFTLKSEEKLAPKVNVLGKIDLSAINQSTRPKKKSKEEKRKQREEKAAQQRQATTGQGGEKKKRERIRSGKVDIEEAAKQQQQQSQQNAGKKKNKGGNQNFNDQPQQGGKGKKKGRQAVKPIEVNEEDVARQVKETLARLTSKTNQNKKGAKYRKEKRDAVAERLSEEIAAEAAKSKTLKLTVAASSTPATATWTNAAGGDWQTGANWDGGSAPASGSSTVAAFTTAAQAGGAAVTLDSAFTVGGVTVDSAEPYTFAGPGRTR